MITTLRLKNWRSHADTILEFKKGTNLLMGIMGSGKSSVVSGICFGLFGTFPELERRKIKLENLFRLNEKELNIVIEFTIENETYRIERTARKEKQRVESDATAYKNNSVVEKGSVAVSNYVENILQIDYDLFTRAIYSEQNNIDYFLTLDPKRRKEEIDVLLGLDKFETARTNAVSTIHRIKTERTAFEQKFNKEEMEKNTKKMQQVETQVLQVKEKVQTLNSTLEALKTRNESEKKTFENLQIKKTHFEHLIKEQISLTSTVDSLKQELKEIHFEEGTLLVLKGKKIQLEKINEATTKELRTHEEEYLLLNKTSATLEARAKEGEMRLLQIQKSQEEIHAISNGRPLQELVVEKNIVLKENQALLLSKISSKSALETTLKEYLEINESLLKGSHCPLCGNAVDSEQIMYIQTERKVKIENTRNKIRELEVEIKKITAITVKETLEAKTIESTLQKIEALQKNTENVEEIHTKQREISAKLSEKKKQNEALQQTREKITKDMQETLVELNKQELFSKKKQELTISEKKLQELTLQITAVGFSEKQYEEVRKTVQELELQYQKIQGEKSSAAKELTSLEEMRQLLHKTVEGNQMLEKEINSLYALEEELIVYKNSLLETQVSLRMQLSESINAAMNEIWHIFYPYGDYTALRLMITERDYGFEIFNGEWRTLESVASGGERACAALTLRVALAMVLTPNVSLLILDEPTHNLDKDAVELLSQTLQFKVPEVVEQTIVITHEESLMGSEFASSYRLMREKEKQESTKAERI